MMSVDSIQNIVVAGTLAFALGSAAVDIGHLADPEFPVKIADVSYDPSDSTFLFSREVHKQFVGEWRAYLKSGSGREITVCSGSGANRFETGVHSISLMVHQVFNETPNCRIRLISNSSYFVLLEINDPRSDQKRFYRSDTFLWSPVE